jgi:succinate-semialdehyde dehydrogenase/glutarate-semialdehyde dehydrogenase
MSYLQSINPYTSIRIAQYKEQSQEVVNAIITKAHSRFAAWKKTSIKARGDKLLQLAGRLRQNKDEYARTITLETGKPISQAVAEVEKCAWVCTYYAQNAAEHLADSSFTTDATSSYVRYDPLGVILAVMPWNYPFWQVFRFAAPALMAGNVCLLKHASNVSGSALKLQQLFLDAGYPEHCFSTLLISSSGVNAVIDHPLVKAVTLTGSEKAGSAVAERAGRAIKKTVLELGGNNALVVLPDCDMEATLETCVQARFQNTGQSCIAGKRLLLHSTLTQDFCDKLKQRVQALRSGDPLDKDTYIGTLAREDLAKELEDQLQKSLAMGARLLCGGERIGAYFAPTLVCDVSPGMPLFDQETFGPVLAITTFNDLDEAIALSNNSRFGLGVSVFTKDTGTLLARLSDFDEGAVFINELVKSDPRLPFGGVKASGYGRELGPNGIREFTNVKTVYIK